MSVFLDTNILVYAQLGGAKADQARELLAAGGKLSIQVLNEFVTVSRRKLQKNWTEIGEAIDDVLALVDPPLPMTFDTHSAATSLARDHGFAFYDALIVASALEAGCETLFQRGHAARPQGRDCRHHQSLCGTIIGLSAGPVG